MKVERALNVEDLRRIAAYRLPRVVYHYIQGGAEEHATLRANREVFEAIRFAPRTLVDVSRRSQNVALYGRVYDSPIGIAPLGAAELFWEDGELALARAACRANVPFVLSTHSATPLQRFVWEAGSAPWFQLYMPRERETARNLVRRAFDAGCEALILTVDVPVNGNREYNQRNGFGQSLFACPYKALDALSHPRWLARVFARAWWTRKKAVKLPHWSTRRDHMSWEDFDWLRDTWPRKLLIKGVLCVEDAQLAAAHGADGIVVSNHGGRQLDGAPSSMEVLPSIAAAVGERLVVAVDSGFRRGSDIVKALALGADMVFVGRAAAYGLAAGGENGVRHALHLLRGEIDRVLALLGCPSVDELGPQFVRSAAKELVAQPPLPPVARLRVV